MHNGNTRRGRKKGTEAIFEVTMMSDTTDSGSMRVFFSDICSKELVELLEMKLNGGRKP